jgi:HEAT repeat protein
MKINLRELDLYLTGLADRDREVRRKALRNLAKFSTDEWSNTPDAVSVAVDSILANGLLRDSQGGDATSRLEAAKTLGNIGTCQPSVIPQLLRLLPEEDDDGVRIEVVRSLSRIGEEAGTASTALIGILREAASDRLRGEAARALARVAPSSVAAIAALRAALHDHAGAVSICAAEALWNVNHKAAEVVPSLSARLTDPQVRNQAVQVLYRIGTDASAAVPALLAAATDPDRLFREAVILALRKIDPKAVATLPSIA